MIDGSHPLDNARTAAFTTLVFAQLFNCFNARSQATSAFRHLFTNPWLWGAVVVSVLLQVAVVNLRFLNVAFGTVPLELGQWLGCAGMGSVVLSFGELRKWLRHVLARSADLHPRSAPEGALPNEIPLAINVSRRRACACWWNSRTVGGSCSCAGCARFCSA